MPRRASELDTRVPVADHAACDPRERRLGFHHRCFPCRVRVCESNQRRPGLVPPPAPRAKAWPSPCLGSHGYSLGEFSTSTKGKLLDVDTRVPLVVRVPRPIFDAPRPPAVNAVVVELVDILPTLLELAQLRVDAAQEHVPLAGGSLVPLLNASSMASDSGDWHALAITTQARCLAGNGDPFCMRVAPHAIQVMGTSVRIAGWRYVAWATWSAESLSPDFSRLTAEELYRYPLPGVQNEQAQVEVERINVVGHKGLQDLRKRLLLLARTSWDVTVTKDQLAQLVPAPLPLLVPGASGQ